MSNRSDHSPWARALSSAQRLPDRYSKRQATVPKVDLKLSITWGSSGPVVVAQLGTSRTTLTRDELNEAWSERASALHKLKQQRREHAARVDGLLHPDWQLMLELDWSSGHAKFLDGALNANGMNVGYGGSQKTPRESTIPSDPAKAALYLGAYSPTLKPGDTQYFYFREGDSPPFYEPSAPKYDHELAKRNRKGEPVIKEGYVDKPKGLKQIAWERGLHKPEGQGKMHGKKVDANDEAAYKSHRSADVFDKKFCHAED